MQQTPAHEEHNPELLLMIPPAARRVIEVGCSSGALAREFKKIAPHCDYLGVEIDPEYARLARRYCDRSVVLDIEQAQEAFWSENADRDCWIFGDTLEHLRDPWAVLGRIRQTIPAAGSVVACIPNAQHWSLQARLSVGDFRYAQDGLLDRTHLRWFTRRTIIEIANRITRPRVVHRDGSAVMRIAPMRLSSPQHVALAAVLGEEEAGVGCGSTELMRSEGGVSVELSGYVNIARGVQANPTPAVPFGSVAAGLSRPQRRAGGIDR